ncbi:MAG: cytoplasmic protein [Gammaproteobacteria bacterium]|nr:cytoplasmic protein [Gammaproteobacteria bacterium]
MNIAFKKREGRYSQLICTRDDGSRSESLFPNAGPLPHDLIHYVVEKTLGFSKAFYGLVASGAPIGYHHEHNRPLADVPDITENWQSESLVQAIQNEVLSNRTRIRNFQRLLQRYCRAHNVPVPTVSEEQLQEIIQALEHYGRQWQRLGTNHQIRVNF